MPLFPLPAAKVCGILANLGDYYGGHVQFMILVTLVFNVIVAAVLCFLNLYICVVHLKFYRDIQLRHGLSIYLICHILATSISIYVVHNAYTPTNELRQEILRTYLNDTYLRDFLYQEKDFVIFGFNPNLSSYTLILINLSRVICIAIWIIVPACLTHMFWYLHKLNKTPDNMLNFKKRIVRMLLTRASAPMLTGFLPTALCFIVAQIWPDQSFIVGNILLVLVFSHGFWICVSTIVIFQPFKEAAKEMFTKPKIFFINSTGMQKQNVNNVALIAILNDVVEDDASCGGTFDVEFV
uniref:Uncharacterized protein n=1 Tax=Acrobeloides nanus TaxID=290746 RepID=A0A914DT69_9BILA